ncbi:MAG: CHASE2 domain-containing protein [Desulfovibrionaceae bacterium]
MQGFSELLIGLWMRLHALRRLHRNLCGCVYRHRPADSITLRQTRTVLGYQALPVLFPYRFRRAACRTLFQLRSLAAEGPRWDVAIGVFVIWGVVGGLWSTLDPFGLGRASSAYSQQIVDRVTAPFYSSAGQDRIVVVLIDDATLESRGEGWPPPYDTYSTFIYRILRQHPKALFVDIMLERMRLRDKESFELAHDTLAALVPEYGIPLIFGQSSPGAPNLFKDIPGVETAAITWNGPGYPLLLSGVGQTQLTPAASLYQHVCAEADIGSPGCPENIDPPHAPPLVPQWGIAISQTMRDRELLPDDDTLFVAPTFADRLLRSGSLLCHSLFVGLDSNAADAAREKWPYAVTVMAHDLDKPQIRGLLRDKAVLLGVSIAGSTDMVVTPANGKLPGVYLHAMALDNLMRYGSRYYTDTGLSWIQSLTMPLCIAILAAWVLGKWPNGGSLYLCLALCLVLAMSATTYLVFRWAPQNWVGNFLLVSLIYRLQKRDAMI